jgi:tetratricopeptide (TPR) repeat protein
MNQLHVAKLLRRADEAVQRRDPAEAIALLHKALRREPNNVHALVHLALIHGRGRDYDRAEGWLARALQTAPRNAELHRTVAEVYSLIDRPFRAAEFWRSSLAQGGSVVTRAKNLVDLAGHLEVRNELEQAAEAVDQALQLAPGHLGAQLLSAVLSGRRNQVALAESKLRSLLRDSALPPRFRVKAYHELAQLLDRQGDYEQAYRTLVLAKELARKDPVCTQLVQMDLGPKWQELRQMLDSTCYAKDDAPRSCAILTGHPRTGTTLLEQILDGHDGLVSSDEFDTLQEAIVAPVLGGLSPTTPILAMLEKASQKVWRTARHAYFQQTESVVGQSIGHRILLEKNPSATQVLPLVNWALPEMKMVVALRDPRDTLISCFMLAAPLTVVSMNWLSIEEAADHYVHQMRCWLTVRSLCHTPWLEVRYEDVIADVEGQARRALDFLGLSWKQDVLRFYDHARNKTIRSPSYKDVVQPVHTRSLGRWQHYAKYLEPVMEKLAPFIKEFGYDP